MEQAPSYDLHVLGTPPAFILSQDQTLHLTCSLFLFILPLKAVRHSCRFVFLNRRDFLFSFQRSARVLVRFAFLLPVERLFIIPNPATSVNNFRSILSHFLKLDVLDVFPSKTRLETKMGLIKSFRCYGPRYHESWLSFFRGRYIITQGKIITRIVSSFSPQVL